MRAAERNRLPLAAIALVVAGLGCGSEDEAADLASSQLGDLAVASLVQASSEAGSADAPSVLIDASLAAAPLDLARGAPPIIEDPIVFGATRKSEMAAYSLRHYGESGWQLTPRQIVLHFTAGSTYASAFGVFSVDGPNRGELPGTCTHYVVDKDGSIYHLVDDGIRCRHTVGLNHVALGIEMVQETGIGAHWADQQILARAAQIDAALRLVKWLQATHGIANHDVIGHATANDSPLFKDLLGWVNDHSDWQAVDVVEFRARLTALP